MFAVLSRLTGAFVVISYVLAVAACGGGGGGSKDLQVSTSSVDFTAVFNTPAPVAKNYSISWSRTDVAGVVIGYPPTQPEPRWLSISTNGNTNPVTVTFNVNLDSMSVGTYSTTVRVVSGTANLNVIDVVDIPVSLTIVDEIISSPLDVVMEMNVGEASTEIQTLNLSQAGAEITPTGISALPNDNWLHARLSNNAVEFSTTQNASALAQGLYEANVLIAHEFGSVSVPVSLHVNQKAVNFVSPYAGTTNKAGDVIIRGHGFSGLSNPEVLFGDTSALSINLVSDSEIHASYPALAAGAYEVSVKDMTTTLPSNASLQVSDAPAYTYVSIARSGGLQRAIYDAQRQAIYITDEIEHHLERYKYNGSSWDVSAINYPISSDGTDAAISPDGQSLYTTNYNSISVFDLDSVSLVDRISTVNFNTDPGSIQAPSLNRIAFANDGKALVTSAGKNNLFSYDIVSGGFKSLSTEFGYVNRFVMASGDGSKIFLPSHDISTIEKAAASYDASSEQLTVSSRLTSNLIEMSVDGSGSRVILSDYRNDQAYVYDENYNELGILPPLNSLDLFSSRVSHALSPDGTRAYLYISTSGKLHVLDLTASDGANGFVEIGSGTVIPDAPADWTKMSISPDGGSLFISSNSQLIVFPVP